MFFYLFRRFCFVLTLIGFAQLLMWEAGHPFDTGMYEQFEYSETLQSLLIAVSVGLLLVVSRKDAVLRPMTLFLSFFLTAVLFRENDWIADLFDQKFLHHLLIWSMLAMLVAILIYWRKGIASALRAWMIQPSKGYIECGLLTVLVFAQLFGRKVHWAEFMNVSFERWVKNAVEEGVESLGYSLIFFGTIELFIAIRRKSLESKQAG